MNAVKQNMKRSIVVAAALALVSACAKQPDQISAADVGPTAYSDYSCDKLDAEHLSISQKLDSLSADQKSAATGDAWGVFLLGLPLSSMSGNDRETAIAIAKGRLQAIDRARQAKGC